MVFLGFGYELCQSKIVTKQIHIKFYKINAKFTSIVTIYTGEQLAFKNG